MSEQEYPTIKQLNGHIIDLRRMAVKDDKQWSATNPSIAHSTRNNFAIMLRSSNYVIMPNGEYRVTTNGTIRSKIYFSELDKDFKIKDLREIDISKLDINLERGLEDPKLFWRDGAWNFTCVTMEKGHTPVARMAICKLDTKKNKVVSIQKLPGIDTKRPEKNWAVTPEVNPNFDYIYGPNAVIKDDVLTTWMTDNEEISTLRGSTNLHDMGDETYLAVVHRMFGTATTTWVPQTFGTVNGYLRDYVHYFARYDNKGKLIALTKGFRFFKPGVEFAAGLVEHKDNFYISYGSNDVSAHIAVIPKSVVLQSLTAIEY
jgi:hypothetical protein